MSSPITDGADGKVGAGVVVDAAAGVVACSAG